MLKIVFMGTADFAVPSLQLLSKNHNIVAVVTATDKPQGRGNKIIPSAVKNFAIENKIRVLQPAKGCKKKKFRVGRGKSSCGGNKCGKGSNGNQQRSGYKRKWGFAGGQTPLCRQLPQYSRINNFRKNKTILINIDLLNNLFKKNILEINTKILVKVKVIKKNKK